MTPSDFTRRGFVGVAATSLVAGCIRPKAEPGLPQSDSELLDDLGEAIVPGARAAKVGSYVSTMLAKPPEQCLLILRYLDVGLPFREVYRSGLGRVAALREGRAIGSALVERLRTDRAGEWDGLPASLFYFIVRSDALDVVYGTPAGAERLGLPYMAHLEPAPLTSTR